MGSSIGSIGTKTAVAKRVLTGMKAAYAYVAFKAGATASEAASAGAHALIAGLDPTSIAVSPRRLRRQRPFRNARVSLR